MVNTILYSWGHSPEAKTACKRKVYVLVESALWVNILACHQRRAIASLGFQGCKTDLRVKILGIDCRVSCTKHSLTHSLTHLLKIHMLHVYIYPEQCSRLWEYRREQNRPQTLILWKWHLCGGRQSMWVRYHES